MNEAQKSIVEARKLAALRVMGWLGTAQEILAKYAPDTPEIRTVSDLIDLDGDTWEILVLRSLCDDSTDGTVSFNGRRTHREIVGRVRIENGTSADGSTVASVWKLS